jgi:eukaryotic-like serine/threonine-protein kinase
VRPDITILNDRYRVDGRIGSGGMAIVYGGTDTLLRRRVAIKMLREQYASDDDFVQRFSYEAQAAAKLSHPNIVGVYDFGRQDHAYFIVMELVEGETLATQVADGKILPEPVAITYAAQIASGLAYAHRQGLLHRDIKPANILITTDDVVKISDFGIARAVSENALGVTQPGMVMGSAAYLSPEQAQGLAIDETSDLYSLGVVLYQMLTGRLPFTGDSAVAVALKHVAQAAPEIDTRATGVSPALASIVARLLQKNPRDRFASASELATALREARERPASTQTVIPSLGDDGTTIISTVRAPQPPPRPSAAPDRSLAPRNGVDVLSDHDARRGNLRLGLSIAAAFVLAVLAGYAFFAHPFFGPAHTIVLADYTGESSSQAQQAVIALGLRPKVTEMTSETIPPDRVVKQDPIAGAKLAGNEDVQLFVSSGPPLAGVPNVLGFARADAERDVTAAHFKPHVVLKYAGDPKDQVIAVSPLAGEQAREGSVVTLVVSRGPQPIGVPNLVSMNVDEARRVLKDAGLRLDIVQRLESSTIPENVIASQDPKDGAQVDPGSSVAVVVSIGAAQGEVPDVAGHSAIDATALLAAAGFQTTIKYDVEPANASGNVTAQDPAAHTQARQGTRVTIVVPVPGTVPDVAGMSLDDAKRALAAGGYMVGNVAETTDGDEGKVIRTEPEANANLRPGEAVTIYYHPPVAP